MNAQHDLPQGCNYDVTFHRLLIAASEQELALLLSADSAGPDAPELIWVPEQRVAAYRAEEYEADAVQRMLTNGLLNHGENGRFSLGEHSVKAVQLTLTPEGERQLSRLHREKQRREVAQQGTGGSR